MGKVSLVKTHGGVKESLGKALDLIGGLGRYVKRNDRVMLKPNLNGVEGCTDRDLVEALIQLLSDFGVGKIFIAESTFGDDSSITFATGTGSKWTLYWSGERTRLRPSK